MFAQLHAMSKNLYRSLQRRSSNHWCQSLIVQLYELPFFSSEKAFKIHQHQTLKRSCSPKLLLCHRLSLVLAAQKSAASFTLKRHPPCLGVFSSAIPSSYSQEILHIPSVLEMLITKFMPQVLSITMWGCKRDELVEGSG